MKGIQTVKVSNRYAKYDFQLFRNITIVRGASGTGKTTLYQMIADYTRGKEKSGVNLSSTAPCIALTDTDWKYQLSRIKGSIVFIDEDSQYITSVEFAQAVKNSDNYYVIFNREGLHNLPSSVNEIYEIKTSGKYHRFEKMYSFDEKNEYKASGKGKASVPDILLTEDTNSGFQFFDSVTKERSIHCEAAGANSAIFAWLKAHSTEKTLILCDGAAFGAEIDRVSKLIDKAENVRLILPESFEWMILKSGIIEEVNTVLENPSEFIESSEYFSWETYFTALLIEKTHDTYLAYTKVKLNTCYLHPSEKSAILAVLPDLFPDS